MNSITEYWRELQETPGASLVLWIFGLVTAVLVAYYFVKLFRDMAVGDGGEGASHFADFEQLHREGKIGREEYDRLKKTIPRNVMAGEFESQPNQATEQPRENSNVMTLAEAQAAAAAKKALRQAQQNKPPLDNETEQPDEQPDEQPEQPSNETAGEDTIFEDDNLRDTV